MTTRPAYSAPYLTFDFVGSSEAVEILLNHAHVGVGYDFSLQLMESLTM